MKVEILKVWGMLEALSWWKKEVENKVKVKVCGSVEGRKK